jgi:hypothetical protein
VRLAGESDPRARLYSSKISLAAWVAQQLFIFYHDQVQKEVLIFWFLFDQAKRDKTSFQVIFF